MTSTFLVLDTSYILELLKVPTFWDEADHAEIFARIESAAQASVPLIVAPGVVFEVADHIADVRHEVDRKRLASKWKELVIAGLESSSSLLFVVYQGDESNGLNGFVSEWCDVITSARPQAKDKGDIGLTDWGTVVVAKLLKKQYSRAKIHIWTKDKRLKRHEPDKEDDSYCGK